MAILRDNWIVIAIAVAVIAALALLIWSWWWVPKWQMHSVTAADPKARADIEDNFRKTVGQALGGAAVLIGAGAAYLQFSQQQQAAHDLLISNQVAKGFEQLASNVPVMQLGGIYGLEGVMNASVQYHQPVLEALCAFVRDGTRGKIALDEPTAEIQAALTVIKRRGSGPGRVELDKATIPRAYLANAILNDANLSGTILGHADLGNAQLRRIDLSGADLSSAELRGADLSDANLRGANLRNADLRDVQFGEADLSGANLSGAKLGDYLTRAKITQDQLNKACGTSTELSPGLTLDKPCPK